MDFSYYKAALAGQKVDISADDPQPGYYRKRDGKDGPYEPVIIWPDKEGVMKATTPKGVQDAIEIWTWVADKPVSKADAEVAFDTGAWPGDVAMPTNAPDLSLLEEVKDYLETCKSFHEAFQDLKEREIMSLPLAVKGDAKPGEPEHQDIRKAQVTQKNEEITKKNADMAANYATHLGRLSKQLDDERKSKVAPHLEAQREVNGKYNPILEEAKKVVKALKAIAGAWLIAQEKKAKEQAEEGVEVKVKAGGQRGRRVGLKTVIRYEVEDADKLIEWAVKNYKMDMLDRARTLGITDVKEGRDVPGLKKIDTKEAV